MKDKKNQGFQKSPEQRTIRVKVKEGY